MPWEPQPGPQSSAILADWCDELFYGGERGGGKSDYQLGYQEDGALHDGPHHRGIMFRRTYPELEELQARAMQVFGASGAVYKSQPSAEYPYSNCWYWPNGASTKMRYIERVQDYSRYHGHQYTRISFDEVTEYDTPEALLKMISTLRSPHGVKCSVRLTGNPGGVGHGWVKQRYISHGPYNPYTDPETGFARMYIPSKTSDNAILLSSDPNYRQRLLAATQGNDALRRAWLEGDWDIVAGAFFDCWDRARHVVAPFVIPGHWLRFRSADWGSAKPFSVGWWAVVSDDTKVGNLTLPRGCLIRTAEWYGSKPGRHNEGIKLTAEAVGAGIAQREHTPVSYGVLDPAAFATDGGPSIAEMIYRGSGNKILFRKADNRRVSRLGAMGGWDQVRQRLIGEADDRPMMVFFSTCTEAIRTLPLMQHDADNIEDVDTGLEDHAPDEIRYACMSRPWVRDAERKRGNRATFNDLREIVRRRAA